MKPYNKIFDEKQPLSKEEMQNYLDDKLSVTDHKKVEEKLIDDDFASEATEGFTESGVSFIATAELSNTWNARNNSTIKTYNYKNWFIGSVVVAVVAVSVVVYLFMENHEYKKSERMAEEKINEDYKNIEANAETSSASSIPNEEKIFTDAELKTEIEVIAESNPIERSKQITYEKTIASQPKTVEAVEPIIANINPEMVDTKKVNDIPVQEQNNNVVESNVKMLYIKNLKAVDYSVFYSANVAKKEWLLTGVSADKENAGSEGIMVDHVVTYIPYKAFLNEYLSKFAENDFKGALTGLLIIQQQFPDDLNASFYSGLCYYNLGKNRQAITAFDKAISNSFTTFKEEAEWYKALCLIEDGSKKNKAMAKELLQKITNDKGFYSKRAAEKLKGMK